MKLMMQTDLVTVEFLSIITFENEEIDSFEFSVIDNYSKEEYVICYNKGENMIEGVYIDKEDIYEVNGVEMSKNSMMAIDESFEMFWRRNYIV